MPRLIKASQKLQVKMKKHHLTARQLAFADLLAMEYEPKDAYQLCGLFDEIITQAENWKNMRKLMQENEAFANYIPQVTKADGRKRKTDQDTKMIKSVPTNITDEESSEGVSDAEMSEMLSKDSQLRALLNKLKNNNLDTKTELDIRKMIADLTNAKRDEVQVEDKRTIFYLPLKCYQCELFMKVKGKR